MFGSGVDSVGMAVISGVTPAGFPGSTAVPELGPLRLADGVGETVAAGVTETEGVFKLPGSETHELASTVTVNGTVNKNSLFHILMAFYQSGQLP